MNSRVLVNSQKSLITSEAEGKSLLGFRYLVEGTRSQLFSLPLPFEAARICTCGLLQLASVLVRYHLDLLPDRCCPSLEVSVTNGAVEVHR